MFVEGLSVRDVRGATPLERSTINLDSECLKIQIIEKTLQIHGKPEK